MLLDNANTTLEISLDLVPANDVVIYGTYADIRYVPSGTGKAKFFTPSPLLYAGIPSGYTQIVDGVPAGQDRREVTELYLSVLQDYKLSVWLNDDGTRYLLREFNLRRGSNLQYKGGTWKVVDACGNTLQVVSACAATSPPPPPPGPPPPPQPVTFCPANCAQWFYDPRDLYDLIAQYPCNAIQTTFDLECTTRVVPPPADFFQPTGPVGDYSVWIPASESNSFAVLRRPEGATSWFLEIESAAVGDPTSFPYRAWWMSISDKRDLDEYVDEINDDPDSPPRGYGYFGGLLGFARVGRHADTDHVLATTTLPACIDLSAYEAVALIVNAYRQSGYVIVDWAGQYPTDFSGWDVTLTIRTTC